MITIRTASVNDAHGIQTVFYKTWLETYPNKEIGVTEEDIKEHFKVSFTDEKINALKKQIANIPDNAKFLVAVEMKTEKIVGLCRIFILENYNQLQAIYVLPEFQGKGIGKSLWYESSQYFDKKKDTIVQVATYNKKAIKFYETLGFVDTGKRFNEERHRMPITKTVIPELEMIRKHAD